MLYNKILLKKNWNIFSHKNFVLCKAELQKTVSEHRFLKQYITRDTLSPNYTAQQIAAVAML